MCIIGFCIDIEALWGWIMCNMFTIITYDDIYVYYEPFETIGKYESLFLNLCEVTRRHPLKQTICDIYIRYTVNPSNIKRC